MRTRVNISRLIPMLLVGAAQAAPTPQQNAGSGQQQPTILVVTDCALASCPGVTDDKLQGFFRQHSVGLADYLKSTGMTVFEERGVTFVFGASIRQEARMKRALDALAHLAKAVRPDGTFDTKSDPVAKEYLDAIAGLAGNTLADDSAAIALPSYKFALQSGDLSVNVKIDNRMVPLKDAHMLMQHPAQPKAKNGPHGASYDDFVVNRPRSFVISGFGTLLGDQPATYTNFVRAIGIIGGWYSDFEKARRQAYREFCAKALGVSISDFVGKTADSLPKNMKDQLEGELNKNFAAYGFPSADAARDFMSKATLTGGDAIMTISVGLPGSGGLGGVGSAQLPGW